MLIGWSADAEPLTPPGLPLVACLKAPTRVSVHVFGGFRGLVQRQLKCRLTLSRQLSLQAEMQTEMQAKNKTGREGPSLLVLWRRGRSLALSATRSRQLIAGATSSISDGS